MRTAVGADADANAGADVGASEGMLLGIEPAGIADNSSDGSVKLVQLMVLQMVQSLASRMVHQMVVQMMVLCLAWSSVQPMEHQIVPYMTMLLLLYCLN